MDHQENALQHTTEESVYERYSTAAQTREESLCCPVEYAGDLLTIIPHEILVKDYGCGDPTPFVREGETVVDLGCGGGKLCYMLAQIVGERGRVIGVDCNRKMLDLARKYRHEVADRLGYDNVEFRYGMIQDLKLDLSALRSELERHPIRDPESWIRSRQLEERLRSNQPMIADESVDGVTSNCVLNLVRRQDRGQLFSEILRVLRRGGRAAISDIVSDEDVPEYMQQNGALWSGCISGAFREDRFLRAFEEAGFHGVEIAKRQRTPWRTVDGIEFRSVTVVAHKGKQGPCLERKQAVIYRGPFKQVEDDDGHVYPRGERMAVCDKTFHLLQQPPYAGMFDPIEPREAIPLEAADAFDCRRSRFRTPRETKGEDYSANIDDIGPCCSGEAPCC
jgi:arsenite methyltransferase